jgi:hypothetical protein
MAALARGCRPATRNLVLFAACNFLGLNVALALATGTPPDLIGAAHTARLLRPPHVYKADSWQPMKAAAAWLRLAPGRPLYEALFFGGKIKFQYPPTSLLATYPLTQGALSALPARLGVSDVTLLNALSWVLVFATAGFAAATLLRAAGGSPGADRLVLAAAGVLLALTYYPVVKAYTLGQIQAWINALVAVLVWCWVGGHRAAGGVLAGLVCLIKPQYGLLVLWGVVRREWRFAAAAVVTGAAGLAISVGLFGLANHIDYLHTLSFIARRGEAFYANQSVNGLLNRLLGNGSNLDWQPDAFPPYHPLVHAGTTASSLALVGLALFWPAGRASRGSVLDLAVAVATCTLASPVAWEHHYGVFLPVYAVLFGALCRVRARPAAWAVLGLSYALTSNFFPGVNALAGTPFNLLQSYVLAGGLLALALLHRFRQLPGERGLSSPRAGPTGS